MNKAVMSVGDAVGKSTHYLAVRMRSGAVALENSPADSQKVKPVVTT